MREVPEVENVYVDRRRQPDRHAGDRAAPRWSPTSCTSPSATVPQAVIEEHPARQARQPFRTCAPTSSTIAASGSLRFGVMGTDGALLDEQARKIQSEMAATGKFRAISSNAALDRPEVIIEPDLDAACRTRHLDGDGCPRRCASRRSATSTQNLAKFTVGDRQIPIRVQLDRSGARRHRRGQPAAGRRPPSGVIGAAVVGGEDQLRTGSVVHRALQPRAPGRDRRGHGAGRRAQRRPGRRHGNCPR